MSTSSGEITRVKRLLIDLLQLVMIAAMAFAIGAAVAGDLDPLIAVGAVTLLGAGLFALVKLFPRPSPREKAMRRARKVTATAPTARDARADAPAVRPEAEVAPEPDEEDESPHGYVMPAQVPPDPPSTAGPPPPEVPTQQPGHGPAPAVDRPKPAEGEHILVVDDEEAARRLAGRILSSYGYRVSTAPDAQLALQLAREDPPMLLLTDLVLPGMTGPALRDRMLAEVGDVSVLFMTSFIGAVRERYGLREGIDEVIEKPFEGGELIRAVGHVLHGRPGELPADERP